jgi:hypothetical protein
MGRVGGMRSEVGVGFSRRSSTAHPALMDLIAARHRRFGAEPIGALALRAWIAPFQAIHASKAGAARQTAHYAPGC